MASISTSRAAKSSRCSAATAPARRRRCARSWASCRGARARSVFEGEETARLASNRIARRGIAYCPEERGIFASLNVEENLLLPPVVREGGLSVEQIYELFPNLKERRTSQGTKLSGGEQQMLAIGRILRTGAQAPAARRTDRRPGAGHRPADRADHRAPEDAGLHDPAGRTEFPFRGHGRGPALRRRSRSRHRHDPQRGSRREHGQAA